MAKRGRKPKERKGYFYENEENAIVEYIHETDEVKRNIIFNTVLYPALTKMIESIIRRYKLFTPDEEFDQNFKDTISYLLTKINHFRPFIRSYDEVEYDNKVNYTPMDLATYKEKARDASVDDPEYISVAYQEYPEGEVEYKYYKKGDHYYKAYSYCGTVCKNYLMYKSSQYSRKRQRNTPYDDVFEDISNNERYSTLDADYAEVAEKLVTDISNEIEKMTNNPEENLLNENEVKVGKALVNLFRNWEEVLPNEGSNKLQKSSVLYFLREETMMTTKEVRDNMKKYKCVYRLLKKVAIE